MLRLTKLVALLISVFLFDVAVIAQTSSEVRKTLGIPTKEFLKSNLLEETYQIDPNLSLNVYYGEDKQVCMMVKSTINIKQTPFFRLEKESLSAEEKIRQNFDISFEKLLKRLEWGKEIKDENLYLGHQTGNCIDIYREEYENASVRKSGSICGENAPFETFTFEWKRTSCRKLKEAKAKMIN